jgi:hypothetical protein
MRRQITIVLTMLAAGVTAAVAVSAAAARVTGKESFSGVLVASGESGTRTIVHSLAVFTGVLTIGGRIVEVPNRPGDPGNVSRDDLVFPTGKMHLISTSKSFVTSVNPKTCAVRVRIRQTGKIAGGTGKFRHAAGRFVGGVDSRGVAFRKPDGTCSQQGALLLEIDIVSGRGTLSF